MNSIFKNNTSGIAKLRLGTRASPLALIQAEDMSARINAAYPEIEVEIVKFTSTGDRVQDRALAEIGGKGLFAKELETALLDGKIDLAVHSMKDLETRLPKGLVLAAVTERKDPRDVLISSVATSVNSLPQGAKVGTASARRAAQMLEMRPDLNIGLIRGNVGTRLSKIDSGEFDATVLAAAGLRRLNLMDTLIDQGRAHMIPCEEMPPAVAQGIVGIEVTEETLEDPEMVAFYQSLNNEDGWAQAALERQALYELDGSCKSAISVYCQIENDDFRLDACVYHPAGQTSWSISVSGELDRANDLAVARQSVRLAAQGLALKSSEALVV